MGCDIHCYIEYKTNTDHWWPFGGRINPGRYYGIFALMAGVRTHDNSRVLFTPRGLPDDIGFGARADNEIFISSETQSEDYATPEQAAEWVSWGSSKYVLDAAGKPTWVTNPDWHSHSWLTTDEFEQALTIAQKEECDCIIVCGDLGRYALL